MLPHLQSLQTWGGLMALSEEVLGLIQGTVCRVRPWGAEERVESVPEAVSYAKGLRSQRL